ncbi:hypothetical protein NBE98_05470 [Clostridium swellfunianum]|uniref:hypothetical protein n=1 Tax=Clostridium swellfunianum TaxID=1367462 RepID=UPI00202F9084|nr:hypothetical protein [Clostridium swellfunianum]MCM0647824.1 hypothetical protein [Clostridium swellfunianum]
MFTFLVFILLIGLCFFVYVYLTNQIVSQRKRIMLLMNQNAELKRKLNKLIYDNSSPKTNNIPLLDLPKEESEAMEDDL